jgi:3-oxoadipate enol-lactonase
VNRIRAQILSTPPDGYIGCCAAIRDMDERDHLGLIEAPALVLIGARDPATTPEKGEYIAERIPGSQKVTLDAAHLSNVEQPADFNRVVLNFLAGKQP